MNLRGKVAPEFGRQPLDDSFCVSRRDNRQAEAVIRTLAVRTTRMTSKLDPPWRVKRNEE
jgi:hypothetical protein